MKRKLALEYVLMMPFVIAGKLYGKIFKLKTQHKVFLFFPNGDIGGSPKVNIDITNCLKTYSPIIFFSKKPNNNLFKERFKQTGVPIIDLHRKIDNKLYHFVNFFYRGVIASWINAVENPVVLGGEVIFFYKIIPHLKKSAWCVEVCHLATWLEYSIGFIDKIDVRVFSTERLKKDVELQYKKNKLNSSYFKKLTFIENAIEIPAYKTIENNRLQVVFIGRGSPQKRVYLIAAIAEQLHLQQAPVLFSFVGDVERVIDVDKYPYCKFYGNVKDDALLRLIYEESDVLILTSAFEGLPVVIMEMMAYGKVIISTNVNGIPDYIFHEQNGFLISSKDEEEIVQEGVNYINRLVENPDLKRVLGARSREIAKQRFDYRNFCREYMEVLRFC
ncbi:glycosyltransferase family 4 protein [Ilyomonas limi]|nr:glycosyltransferase family 4 protein [Ilyomonas limi]